jgi:vancomycin permeability regulator SanA
VIAALMELPAHDVGLLPGASVTLPTAIPTGLAPPDRCRGALVAAGAVRHLLVSGDKQVASHVEFSDIRQAPIARGAPAATMTVDDAGFHTLDPVARAQRVVAPSGCAIIWHAGQDARALAIARHYWPGRTPMSLIPQRP